MAVTFTFENLEDGQEILVPYEVIGKAAAGANIVIMSMQIDDQEMRDIDFSPDPNAANTYDFEANVSEADCPTSDCWYLLTIYAWEAGGVVSTGTRTFKRIGSPPPDPIGIEIGLP